MRQPAQYQPRQPMSGVGPQFEDSGLFAGQMVRVNLHLTPDVRLNTRQDVVATGLTGNGITFDVLFAGRRKAAAQPLMAALAAMRKTAAGGSGARLAIQIDGVWRTTFATDPSGWDQRRRQLVAAMWVVTLNGRKQQFGERPRR
ncbi:hypothetical protein AB3Y40_09360 [Yoonia sp. R2331]|uniref:hypothetical protein n=1 Tax=Yoonia sp. R2331 TaxID=3237238 RepID=UPI0034E417C5